MDEHPENNDILKIIAETAEFGMLAAVLPEERGGQGLDLYSFLLALQEIARESAAVAAVGLSHNLACKALELAELELPESGPGRTDLYCLGLPARLEVGGAGSVVSGGCDFLPGLPLASRAVLAGAEGEVVSVALEGKGVTVACEFTHGLRAARPGALELDARRRRTAGQAGGRRLGIPAGGPVPGDGRHLHRDQRPRAPRSPGPTRASATRAATSSSSTSNCA